MREYARQVSLNSTFNAHETLVTWSKVIKGDFDVANRHLTMRHAHSYEGQVCMCVSAACVYLRVCVYVCVCACWYARVSTSMYYSPASMYYSSNTLTYALTYTHTYAHTGV